ncbi:hypothetical protein BDV33DRAFT_171309 [Aspergillus novoparasiticus]|uniref:Uncharacterized protein n=1 Tax=Aspergillus novoparasiticus TaxID=986946 RepID=A0A5N6EVF7_9EURO|nr:hypothetical protein BDV33DRAFT_171309 [Aspergillus novoparasiticus]
MHSRSVSCSRQCRRRPPFCASGADHFPMRQFYRHLDQICLQDNGSRNLFIGLGVRDGRGLRQRPFYESKFRSPHALTYIVSYCVIHWQSEGNS